MDNPIPQTLDDVLKELCTHYCDDTITPGIQVAYLPQDQLFYAAVHQFPSGVSSRKVVSKAKAATSGLAMAEAMKTWRSIVGSSNPKEGG